MSRSEGDSGRLPWQESKPRAAREGHPDRRYPLDRFTVALLLAGVALYLAYFSVTGPMVRNPDAGSHLAYVKQVAEALRLPAARDCSVCHHPPLYYVAAGAVYRAALALGAPAERGLQLFSLLLTAAFTLLSAKTLARLARRPYQLHLGTALVVFWPTTVLCSVRINNDVALLPFAALVFHGLVRWWEEPARRRWLGLAALAALVGTLVKANALVLVAMVVAVAVLRIVREGRRASLARSTAPVLLALVAVSAVGGLSRGEPGSTLPERVLGGAYKTRAADLDPHPTSYYLSFDPRSFVREPYAEARSFKSSEPTFWNHWLKSSLFGTQNRIFGLLFGTAPPNAAPVARALNALLLALLGLGGLGLWLSRGRASRFRPLLLACVLVYATAAVGFHVAVPAAHHADFRFVYPVLAPASAVFAEGVDGMRQRRLFLWHAGYLLAELVVAFSIAYFAILVTAEPASFRPRPGSASLAPNGRLGVLETQGQRAAAPR